MPIVQTTRVYAEVQNALESGYTTVSAQGSARSSKTYNIMIWLIVRCLRIPKTTVSVVRATLPAIKGSVYRDFEEIMISMGVWERKRMNLSDFIYKFPNGSWIEFFSCDNEQKMRGRKRKILYANEGNELTFIQWQQLQMRTTQFSIIDYNPSFSDDHWICGLNDEDKTYHFISTYKDNPFLEQKVIDEIESLRNKNRSLWQIYGLGLQAVVEGLIFKNIHIVDEIPETVKYRWRVMDLGYSNDPTAILYEAVQGNRIYVDEICYNTEMLTSDIIRVLKENGGGTMEVISESADPRMIQEIYRGGVNIHPVVKFPNSVQAGITKMLEYEIYITKRSVNTIKEFKNYTWMQDKEGAWLNRPIDAYNHSIDALRYGILMKVLGGQRKPVDMANLARVAHR